MLYVNTDLLNTDEYRELEKLYTWGIPSVEQLHQFDVEMLRNFAWSKGMYFLPTRETLDVIETYFVGKTVEVGAGNGMVSSYLGITGTDNKMQLWPEIAKFYRETQQPVVRYGSNVQEMDAHETLERYMPDTVIGCWVTQKYDEARREAGGNMYGIDFSEVFAKVKRFIFVGNRIVHRAHPIFQVPTTEIKVPCFSRATSPQDNVVLLYEREKHSEK